MMYATADSGSRSDGSEAGRPHLMVVPTESNTPDDANSWVDKFMMEAKAAVKANPLGSDPLEKTDCEAMKPWFTKYGKWVRPKKKS